MITITKEQSYEVGRRLCRIMELAKGDKTARGDEIYKNAETCFRWITRKEMKEFRSDDRKDAEGSARSGGAQELREEVREAEGA